MQSKLLHEADGQRTFALIFETGDELLAGIKAFAQRERLSAAQFSAIGAFSDVVLAYFDWETKQYQRRKFAEQVEVASLTGDIAESPDGPAPPVMEDGALPAEDDWNDPIAFGDDEGSDAAADEDDPVLVTESLARLYHLQGHLERAAVAYQTLAARHPEQPAFAEQAEALERELLARRPRPFDAARLPLVGSYPMNMRRHGALSFPSSTLVPYSIRFVASGHSRPLRRSGTAGVSGRDPHVDPRWALPRRRCLFWRRVPPVPA